MLVLKPAALFRTMYTQFFRLNQAPFSIAPDPRYLFMSERHREALAHLLYGISSGGGFVVLTGEIGAGKTTVCRCFLEQIPENCNVAYIFNPKLTVNELLQSICDEFGVEVSYHERSAATIKNYVDALNRHLLASHAEGRNNVLVIDEAQNLTEDVLEQLRLLTNLETNERKLLQIILIGQPELRTMLASANLKQLAQRVIARYHLGSLSLQETELYIQHRLSVAGLVAASPFPHKAMRRIHSLSQGVPRRINLLCDRAMLGAYAQGKPVIDLPLLDKAADEVFGKPQQKSGARVNSTAPRYAIPAGAALVVMAFVAGLAWNKDGGLSESMRRLNAALPQSIATVGSGGGPDTASPIADGATEAPVPPPNAGTADGTTQSTTADPAPASASLSDMNALLSEKPGPENSLYLELARLWNVDLEQGGACDAARKQGLHCYASRGGLQEIRQLDRPAILKLRDETDQTRYALLVGLTNAGAALRIGQQTHVVSLVALGRRFDGEFLTFWRAPEPYRNAIAAGARGQDVDWIASQLATLNGKPKPAANLPFDQDLMRQLREFQEAQGLEPDGIAGPKTFMHLNSATGVAEPRLLHGKLASSAK